MPLTRYQIRNEYSLADPELYRAADKDDPEALLEGVAMAGLVGVLRQLGDLAEFAAQIFHDLHEELMATAARGHGLTLRVQQLEAEFPQIEKAFLSEINHSQYIQNAGVDWHPNLQIDQNLITRGDLPRFVMDSYEECRGPPRLFLLDKFDIAGAGACLKRYSDPSFFRAEFTSKTAQEDAKRDKRARKVKKKVARWKNVETPELKTSNIKLHQLFQEEHIQSENSVRPHHVKLKKRQSNSSLAEATTGKSYMERFLLSPPDRKTVYGTYASSSRLKIEPSNSRELVPETHEISSRSPSKELVTRDVRCVPSVNIQEKALDTSVNELSESKDVFVEEDLEQSPELTPDIELMSIPSTLYKVEDKMELVIYGEDKVRADVDGYRSDDATSEVDNYVDALATMDSEMETDTPKKDHDFNGEKKWAGTESKPKKDHDFKSENKWAISDTTAEKELQTHYSDSHSMGNSVASDDGNNSSKKGSSSLSYSDTSSNSPENVPSDGDEATDLQPCTPAENFDISSRMNSEIGNANGSRSEECAVLDSTCNDASENLSHGSQSGKVPYNSDAAGLTSALRDSSPGVILNEGQLLELNSLYTLSDEGNSSSGEPSPRTEIGGGNTGKELPWSSNISNTPSQSREDSLSVASHKSQPMEMVGSSSDVSYDANSSGPAGEEGDSLDDSVSEAALPSSHVDDNHTENLLNGEIDTSDLNNMHKVEPGTDNLVELEHDVRAPSSTNRILESVSCSRAEGDLNGVSSDDIALETSYVPQFEEKSKGCTETDDIREQKLLEVTDQVPVLELDFAEIGSGSSTLDPSCNNLELKEEFEPNRVCLTHASATDRDIDASLNSPTGCSISDVAESVSVAEAHLMVAGLDTGNVCVAEDGASIEDHMATNNTLCLDQTKLQECPSSSGDLETDDVEITMLSDDKDKAENQSLDYNIKPVQHIQNHLHHCDDTEGSLLLKEYNQEIDEEEIPHSNFSVIDTVASSINLPEPENPLLQGLELQSENSGRISLQEVEGYSAPFCHQDEQTGCVNQSDCDGYSSQIFSSSSQDPLSQQVDLDLPILVSHELDSSDPAVIPLQPISNGFGLHPEGTNQVPWDQQLDTTALDLSVSDHNAFPASVEEIPPLPPLPPLPPMQWRIGGKLQHGFPSSEGEVVQHSSIAPLPLSIVPAGEEAQQGIPTFHEEFAHQPNPFLVYPSLDDEKLQQGVQNLGSETMQPSLNPSHSVESVVKDEKIQYDHNLNTTTTLPQNPFLPLSDEDAQHDSFNLREEVLQTTSSNLVSPTPIVNNMNTEHAFSIPEEEQPPMDLLARVLNKEDQKLYRAFLGSSRESVQTIENEKLGNGKQTLEGETEWQSSSSTVMPTVNDRNLNGTLKSRLARPRDPLIEAVASHDKSNLRKVAERVLPQIGPKVGERNSLLEQIRTKSFNLKPASVTRPSIQGPRTNLKVVAILEKANAIRQALAGSDDEDDDEDSWSDS